MTWRYRGRLLPHEFVPCRGALLCTFLGWHYRNGDFCHWWEPPTLCGHPAAAHISGGA